DPRLTADVKNRILGEALALRGLAYFDLARTFGGVPVITQPTLSPNDNRGIPRASQQDTYKQALADRELAEGLVEEHNDRHRISKKTVQGLKARYFLYQNNYQQAEAHANLILSDHQYRLVAPYSAFFKDNARATEESIFEIYYNGTTEVN